MIWARTPCPGACAPAFPDQHHQLGIPTAEAIRSRTWCAAL